MGKEFKYFVKGASSPAATEVRLEVDEETGHIDMIVINEEGESIYVAGLTPKGKLIVYAEGNFANLPIDKDEDGAKYDYIPVEWL